MFDLKGFELAGWLGGCRYVKQVRFEEVELETATFTAPAWDGPATLTSRELDQQRNRKYLPIYHVVLALIQNTVHRLFTVSVVCYGVV